MFRREEKPSKSFFVHPGGPFLQKGSRRVVQPEGEICNGEFHWHCARDFEEERYETGRKLSLWVEIKNNRAENC